MIERNFAGNGNKKIRVKLAKRILKNECYRYCIKTYKKDLDGKLGIILRMLFKVNNPLVLCQDLVQVKMSFSSS